MKYALECKVDSLHLIQKEIKYNKNDKEYILKPNTKGFIQSIKIIKTISNPESFFSEIIEGKGDSKLTINIKADEDVFNELKFEFQYLESSLAFGSAPIKIHWESPTQEWIAENKEEREKLKVFKTEVQRGYPIKPVFIEEEDIISFIDNKKDYEELTVLKTFYNNGGDFFRNFRYINAFYNFYYVIEDVYGGGKTQNRAIMNSYKKSRELKEHIKWVRDNYIDTSPKHKKNLDVFLKDMNKTDSVNDIIEFLVLTRGRLHHYSRKSTIKIGTPLNRLEYETVAFFMLGLAFRAILQEILNINKKLGIAK